MTLAHLVQAVGGQIEVTDYQGDLEVPIQDLTDDSRLVKAGSLFVAVQGTQVDGHQFVGRAIQSGAAALVIDTDHQVDLSDQLKGATGTVVPPVIQVRNSRRALGLFASHFYGNPSSQLRMVGITGTNGKTTVTYLCKALLEYGGKKVGLLGTVAYLIGDEVIPASHTTPGAVACQGLLAHMRSAGADATVMEVSSHALALDRTVGCEFDVAVFTNLTQDHLDFHGSLEEYFRAKTQLFTGLMTGSNKPGTKRAIVNIDDPRGVELCEMIQAPKWTYSLTVPSDLRAEQVRMQIGGTTFVAVTPHGSIEIETQLVGEYNIYNLLAAIGVALHEGLSLLDIQQAIRAIPNVPGRFERIEGGQTFSVVVDYAHTDDALDRLLTAAQTLKVGRILTVFGCGGDRDRGKRPKMGKVAAQKSDLVFLTSDNPRTEDPLKIIQEVEVGIQEGQKTSNGATGYSVYPDRAVAIEAAIREAKAGDMVLIAGKGHEDYQIIGTQRHHFDDREIARAAIQKVLG